MSATCNIQGGGCYANGNKVRIPVTLRAGGCPRLNFSSERHSADQGERHQGGEDAEEMVGNLHFHNHITFLYLSFCGAILEMLCWDDCWKTAYHTGISSYYNRFTVEGTVAGCAFSASLPELIEWEGIGLTHSSKD